MKTIATLLLFLGSTQGFQQKEQHKDTQREVKQTPTVLTEYSVKLLPSPSFTYGENVQCDLDGNMYFHASDNFNESVVLRLKQDGSQKQFKLSSEDAKNNFILFRIDPEGRVRILDQAQKQSNKLHVHEFSSESSDAIRTDLEVPVGLLPTSFLVLGNDHILIYGYFDEDAASNNKGKRYIGEFDSSGKLIRQTNETASGADIQEAISTAPNNAVAEAIDGHSYILVGDAIIVLSAAGKVLEKRHIVAPEEGYRPVNIFTDGAFLVVAFYKAPQKGDISGFLAMYQLLNRQTGELIRTYKPGPELGNVLACFSSEGFTFIRVQNNRTRLFIAKP